MQFEWMQIDIFQGRAARGRFGMQEETVEQITSQFEQNH